MRRARLKFEQVHTEMSLVQPIAYGSKLQKSSFFLLSLSLLGIVLVEQNGEREQLHGVCESI
jgi:hypothetical protein